MPRKTEQQKILRKELIDRKVLFYRFDQDGKPGAKPPNYDPTPALKRISGLEFNPDGRYQVDLNGDAFVCWPESLDPPWKIIFGKTRRYNLPQQEIGGSRKALAIPAAAGLCEVSHMVWFPGNILGVERTGGVTPAHLQSYLSKKAEGIYSGQGFDLLIKRQALSEFRKLEEVRLLHVKIQRSYADLMSTADKSLGSAFQAQMDAVNADEIEVILRVRRGQTHGLSDSIMNGLAKLARRKDLAEKVEALIVKGPTIDGGKMREVDFLKDELIVTRAMLRTDPRSRAVQSESAFREIEAAYNEVESVLVSASSLKT